MSLEKVEAKPIHPLELTIRLGKLSLGEDHYYLSPLLQPARDFLETQNGVAEIDVDEVDDNFLPLAEHLNSLRETVAPFIGGVIRAKSRNMVFESDGPWVQFDSEAPIFVAGTVCGIESHAVTVERFTYYGQMQPSPRFGKPDEHKANFRTGLVMELTERPYIWHEAVSDRIPQTDHAMIPLYSLPRRDDHNNWLRFDQILEIQP